jgi:hypothetical protein
LALRIQPVARGLVYLTTPLCLKAKRRQPGRIGGESPHANVVVERYAAAVHGIPEVCGPHRRLALATML